MNNYSKWVTEVSPSDRVNEAAVQILKTRFKAVKYYLRRAAQGEARSAVQDVHELRVWTRRSIAAVSFFKAFLKRSDSDWLIKQLRRIRKAAGDARDDDVLLERLACEGFGKGTALIQDISAHRRAAQRPIRKIHEKLILTKKFQRRVKESLDRLRRQNRGNRMLFATWADKQLHRTLEKFFRAADDSTTDPKKLHRFRIRGKDLRYTMELTAAVYPPPFREDLYGQIARLQDQLGELNDHAVAQARFTRWSRNGHGNGEHRQLGAMIEQEADQLAESHARYRKWWTNKRIKTLRVEFARCLGNELS